MLFFFKNLFQTRSQLELRINEWKKKGIHTLQTEACNLLDMGCWAHFIQMEETKYQFHYSYKGLNARESPRT